MLWDAVRTDVLSVISTDHCAFLWDGQKTLGKDDFSKIPNGGPGLENRLHMIHEFGVRAGRISLNRMVELWATNPAKYFGLYPRKGTIAVGSDADLVVFDPEKRHTISAATHHSKADYNLFEGTEVTGSPELVLLRGHLLVENDELVAAPGVGQFVKRARFGEELQQKAQAGLGVKPFGRNVVPLGCVALRRPDLPARPRRIRTREPCREIVVRSRGRERSSVLGVLVRREEREHPNAARRHRHQVRQRRVAPPKGLEQLCPTRFRSRTVLHGAAGEFSPSPGKEDDVGELAAKRMKPGDVRMLLLRCGSARWRPASVFRPRSLPLRIRRRRPTQQRLRTHLPRGHRLARKTFSVKGQALDVHVEFAAGQVSDQEIGAANRILGQLRISARKARF